MAIDISNLVVSSLVVLVSVIVFLITYSIYRRTKGGSYGFKCWAIAAALYLIGRGLTLAGIIMTQSPNDFLTRVIGQGLFQALGAFFVMLGILFLAVDMKVSNHTKEGLIRLQNASVPGLAAVFILIIASVFSGMLPQGLALAAGTVLSSCFETLFWGASAITLYSMYKTLRQGSKGWTVILLGAVMVVINDAVEVFLNLGYGWLADIDVVTSILFSSLLVAGFFLIDRSMKG